MQEMMHELNNVEVVLLDIEGTVCPISFVKNILFPYALETLPTVLSTEWTSPTLRPYISAFPPSHSSTPEAVLSHVHTLMSQDLKIPYLKSLQGYLWQRGYTSGTLTCPLFPDVQPSLNRWVAAGAKIVIYSSGSVEAQKLLFRYTDCKPAGDLRGLIAGWYDTVNAGMKNERESYEKIVEKEGGEVGKWLFLSDNVKEVTAAKEAGMQSFIVVREGNAPLTEEQKEGHVLVESFEEIQVQGGGKLTSH